MSQKIYNNNEDIILTSKRVFPDKQNMPDPNKSGTLYKGGNIRPRDEKMGIVIPRVLNSGGSGESVLTKMKSKDFEEEFYNTCQRCGVNIGHLKLIESKLYTYGLCKDCNDLLEREVRGRNMV